MLRSLIGFRKKHSLKPLDPLAMHCMHERERMHALVHRERARADRTGHPFSLVTFKLPRYAMSRRNQLRLAKTALTRSRVTDDIGWFDNNTVAALLPETSSQGAWKYAQGVLTEFQEKAAGARIEITVFAYPTNWFNDDSDRGSDGRVSQPTRKYRPGAALPEGVSAGVLASEQAMEPLFVQPMPTLKRLVDIAVSAAVLIAASPVLLAAALAVRFTSRGPIIFKQPRAGLGGKPFTMYKFRSMYIDSEARLEELRKHSEVDGPVFKMKNDPRITPAGRFIRKTSIDELPQLLNVLKGDMSLVGPRPPIIKETHEYESWQYRRLEVTPGLTCIWQVSGRSGISFDQWMRMDAQYAVQRSLFTDLKILLQTVPAVLFGRGAC